MITTMGHFRLQIVLCMEKVCGRKEIPSELRQEIINLQVELQRQIVRDLGLAETPGCLSRLPDTKHLSIRASSIMEKLAGKLASC